MKMPRPDDEATDWEVAYFQKVLDAAGSIAKIVPSRTECVYLVNQEAKTFTVIGLPTGYIKDKYYFWAFRILFCLSKLGYKAESIDSIVYPDTFNMN